MLELHSNQSPDDIIGGVRAVIPTHTFEQISVEWTENVRKLHFTTSCHEYFIGK